MKFDFNWFLTIPGLFITGGVILLIISLIMLIVSGKKNRKVSGSQPNVQPQKTVVQPTGDAMANAGVTTTPISAGGQSVAVPDIPMSATVSDVQAIPEVQPQVDQGFQAPPVVPVQEYQPTSSYQQSVAQNYAAQDVNGQSTVMPTMPAQGYVATPNYQTPVEQTPVQNYQTPVEQTPVQNYQSMPTYQQVSTQAYQQPAEQAYQAPTNYQQMPEMSGVTSPIQTINEVQSNVQPSTESFYQTQQPTIEQPQVADGQNAQPVSIYGGASPIVPDINMNTTTEPHQIYGGADPMENTRNIPIVNNPVMENIQQPVMSNPTIVEPQQVYDYSQPQVSQQPTIVAMSNNNQNNQ